MTVPPGAVFFCLLKRGDDKSMNSSAEDLAGALLLLRERAPVVHTITNWVTAGDVANALHAAGARPVMAFSPKEVAEIVAGADALVLNLGTPEPSRVRGMFLAARHANQLNRPIVFDPVGVAGSRFRTESARGLLSEIRMTIIRGNRAEIGALAEMGGQLRGIDAETGPSDLVAAARALSLKTGAVVAVTGPEDLIVRGERRVIVKNGHPIMARMTGTGCILSALIGAFASVEADPLTAATAAIAFFGVAGEKAALRAQGPGTFRAALFDVLFELSPDELKKEARLTD
jgi:hydroxyethylthiazole kinase